MDKRKLVQQLYETFDLIYSALDSKQKEIERLIKEADERIAQLKELMKGENSKGSDFLMDATTQKVISAYKQGKTVKEIAVGEGMHTGEVELIINLYRAKNESRSNR